MANRTWAGGGQITRPKIMTLTVTTADTGADITITCGTAPSAQSVVVRPTTTNTTTTAAEILTAISAVVGGTWSEISTSQSTNVVTFTSASGDGRPFDISKVDGGGNVTVLATTVPPLSPNDFSDPKNWLGGVAPTGLDRIVFENTSVAALWNLDAFSAVVLASGSSQTAGVIRRRSFTGQLGLPAQNPAGFPEYRARAAQFNCDGIFWEASSTDQAGQFVVESTFAGGNVTAIVQGDGNSARVGSEALEMFGFDAAWASTLDITQASVALCPLGTQDGKIFALNAIGSTVRIGTVAVLSGTVDLKDCSAQIGASWTTMLTVDGTRTALEVIGNAGGPITLQGGYTTWRSTGNPGANPVLGGGATLDLNSAPDTLTIGGIVEANAGSALLDEYGRGGLYVVKGNRCSKTEFTWTTPADITFSMS